MAASGDVTKLSLVNATVTAAPLVLPAGQECRRRRRGCRQWQRQRRYRVDICRRIKRHTLFDFKSTQPFFDTVDRKRRVTFAGNWAEVSDGNAKVCAKPVFASVARHDFDVAKIRRRLRRSQRHVCMKGCSRWQRCCYCRRRCCYWCYTFCCRWQCCCCYCRWLRCCCRRRVSGVRRVLGEGQSLVGFDDRIAQRGLAIGRRQRRSVVRRGQKYSDDERLKKDEGHFGRHLHCERASHFASSLRQTCCQCNQIDLAIFEKSWRQTFITKAFTNSWWILSYFEKHLCCGYFFVQDLEKWSTYCSITWLHWLLSQLLLEAALYWHA